MIDPGIWLLFMLGMGVVIYHIRRDMEKQGEERSKEKKQ